MPVLLVRKLICSGPTWCSAMLIVSVMRDLLARNLHGGAGYSGSSSAATATTLVTDAAFFAFGTFAATASFGLADAFFATFGMAEVDGAAATEASSAVTSLLFNVGYIRRIFCFLSIVKRAFPGAHFLVYLNRNATSYTLAIRLLD